MISEHPVITTVRIVVCAIGPTELLLERAIEGVVEFIGEPDDLAGGNIQGDQVGAMHRGHPRVSGSASL